MYKTVSVAVWIILTFSCVGCYSSIDDYGDKSTIETATSSTDRTTTEAEAITTTTADKSTTPETSTTTLDITTTTYGDTTTTQEVKTTTLGETTTTSEVMTTTPRETTTTDSDKFTATTTSVDVTTTPPRTTTTEVDTTTSTPDSFTSTSTDQPTTTPSATTTTDITSTLAITETTSTDRTTTTYSVTTITTSGTTREVDVSTDTSSQALSTTLQLTTTEQSTEIVSTTTKITPVETTTSQITDDVKNYVIIALSVVLGLLLIGIIVYCVYMRITRTGRVDILKDSSPKSNIVSSGTQTEDPSVIGLTVKPLPPIATNMKLISEKTRFFGSHDYIDKMGKGGKLEGSWDHFYYPDAPPIVSKPRLENKSFESAKYQPELDEFINSSRPSGQNSDGFCLMTDQYHNYFAQILMSKKKDEYLPDVEQPSTSASEHSTDLGKKYEVYSNINQNAVITPKSFSPDREETSSGFSDEHSPSLSTEKVQKGTMAKYTVRTEHEQNSEQDVPHTGEDLENSLEENAVDLHFPVTVSRESPITLEAWENERPKGGRFSIESKNTKVKFTRTDANETLEDDADNEFSPLMQQDRGSKARSVSFNINENERNEFILRGKRFTKGNSSKASDIFDDPAPVKKKKRRSNISKKQMAEKILFATYGFADLKTSLKRKGSKSGKQGNKKKRTASAKSKTPEDRTATPK